ncbi:MAG TPA: DUF6036 family nucleotidyltransferase [Nitrospiria bacterium]
MNPPGQDFVSAMRDLIGVLQADYKGMIIGGMAVIALGYPRVTTDIDATVLAAPDRLDSLVERLGTHHILPRIEKAKDFARSHHVLLMRHQPSGIDVDITIAMLPFEEEAIAHRQPADFAGVRIFIPKAEDLVIYKIVASRPDDLRDVEELLLRHFDKIDFRRVRSVVKQFADALERPEMTRDLEALIKKTEK